MLDLSTSIHLLHACARLNNLRPWQHPGLYNVPRYCYLQQPGLVLGGEQMTARLYRFDECPRFHGYREGALIRRPLELFYNAVTILDN